MSENMPDTADKNAPETAAVNGYKDQLVEHLLAIQNAGEMDSALDSLLTPSEYQEISKRLQIFRLLEAGVPHRRIAEILGVGIATVSRGAKAFPPHPAAYKDSP